MTRIYLIRHAEAEGNIKRIFQGHTDADISENGENQLEKLSERCRNLSFSAIYSSPLKRTLKTAQAANRYHGLEIIKDAGLIEINGGHWEGVMWEKLPALYPEENFVWENAPWDFSPEGGETMREVYDRIWTAVTGIVRKHRNETVCIVSHGCAIRNFLCRAYGKPVEALNDIPWCDNTAVSIIDFDDLLRPTVVIANDASHLSDELSTIQKQSWWKNIPSMKETR